MSTSNDPGFARVVPFVLATFALFWLASTAGVGGWAPALAFAAITFAALSLAMHLRHPAGVRASLLVAVGLAR